MDDRCIPLDIFPVLRVRTGVGANTGLGFVIIPVGSGDNSIGMSEILAIVVVRGSVIILETSCPDVIICKHSKLSGTS